MEGWPDFAQTVASLQRAGQDIPGEAYEALVMQGAQSSGDVALLSHLRLDNAQSAAEPITWDSIKVKVDRYVESHVELSGGPVPMDISQVHKGSGKGARQRTDDAGPCNRCGKNHRSSTCRYRDTVCRACGKTGHIEAVCKSKHGGTKGQAPANSRRSGGEGPKCTVCGGTRHSPSECRYKDAVCNNCGRKGHLRKVCRSAQEVRETLPDRLGCSSSDSKAKTLQRKCHVAEAAAVCRMEGHSVSCKDL